MTKTSYFILAALLCVSSLANAQEVKISSVPVGKLQNLSYIGTDKVYHYYSSTDRKIHRFDKKNMNTFNTMEYAFDNKKEYVTSKYILDEKLYIVSKYSETDKPKKLCTISIYHFDPISGAKVYVAKTGGLSDKILYYSCYIDSANKNFVITIEDSVVNRLDYKLQKVEFDKNVKYKLPVSHFDISDLVFDLEELFKSFGGMKGLKITTSEPEIKTSTDSTSVKNFIMTYVRKNDEKIGFFKKYITEVKIRTRKMEEKEAMAFSLESDKRIIDQSFMEDKDGNLIYYGKYVTISGGRSEYGMFTTKYSLAMKEITPLKYYNLVGVKTGLESVPNEKYIGLFYTKLQYEEYTYNLEDGTRMFLYQKDFTNVKDHIYIIKVAQSGELVFNMVPNKIIVDKKNSYRTAEFRPMLVKDRLYFFFYDNPVNIDRSMSDVNVAWCDASDKKSVLVSCYYNIASDDMRKKRVIAENSSFKTQPYLNEASIYHDPETGEHMCLVPGENKKGVSKMLYQLNVPY